MCVCAFQRRLGDCWCTATTFTRFTDNVICLHSVARRNRQIDANLDRSQSRRPLSACRRPSVQLALSRKNVTPRSTPASLFLRRALSDRTARFAARAHPPDFVRAPAMFQGRRETRPRSTADRVPASLEPGSRLCVSTDGRNNRKLSADLRTSEGACVFRGNMRFTRNNEAWQPRWVTRSRMSRD